MDEQLSRRGDLNIRELFDLLNLAQIQEIIHDHEARKKERNTGDLQPHQCAEVRNRNTYRESEKYRKHEREHEQWMHGDQSEKTKYFQLE
jgi:hypothetical protein